jgi:hypothetical protein
MGQRCAHPVCNRGIAGAYLSGDAWQVSRQGLIEDDLAGHRPPPSTMMTLRFADKRIP